MDEEKQDVTVIAPSDAADVSVAVIQVPDLGPCVSIRIGSANTAIAVPIFLWNEINQSVFEQAGEIDRAMLMRQSETLH